MQALHAVQKEKSVRFLETRPQAAAPSAKPGRSLPSLSFSLCSSKPVDSSTPSSIGQAQRFIASQADEQQAPRLLRRLLGQQAGRMGRGGAKTSRARTVVNQTGRAADCGGSSSAPAGSRQGHAEAPQQMGLDQVGRQAACAKSLIGRICLCHSLTQARRIAQLRAHDEPGEMDRLTPRACTRPSHPLGIPNSRSRTP